MSENEVVCTPTLCCKGIPEARRPLHGGYGGKATDRPPQADQRGDAASGDHEGASGREVGGPLPSAARHGLRHRPGADPAVRAAGGGDLPGRRADHQVCDPRRQGVRRDDPALRSQVEHRDPGQPWHGELWRDRGEGLLVDRDPRRLLPHVDVGQRTGPDQLLQRSPRPRPCWTSRASGATKIPGRR